MAQKQQSVERLLHSMNEILQKIEMHVLCVNTSLLSARQTIAHNMGRPTHCLFVSVSSEKEILKITYRLRATVYDSRVPLKMQP